MRYRSRSAARDLDPEPCSIGCDTIVEYLEQMGRPKMAAFARRFEQMDSEHARERVAFREREQQLLARLAVYEPHVEREIHNPRPPAEASG